MIISGWTLFLFNVSDILFHTVILIKMNSLSVLKSFETINVWNVACCTIHDALCVWISRLCFYSQEFYLYNYVLKFVNKSKSPADCVFLPLKVLESSKKVVCVTSAACQETLELYKFRCDCGASGDFHSFVFRVNLAFYDCETYEFVLYVV